MIEYIIFWIAILVLTVAAIVPFWFVKKVLKWHFTVLNVWAAVIVASIFLVLILLALDWLLVGYRLALDWAAFIIVWVGVPSLVIGSVVGPFIVMKKILKWPFTGITVLLGLVVAGGLLWLVLWGLYWGVVWLQGQAFCSIYGC